MIKHPEHEICISDNHLDNKGKSWCGKGFTGFTFTSVDHAALNGRNGGRLIVCRDCLPLVLTALCNGTAHD